MEAPKTILEKVAKSGVHAMTPMNDHDQLEQRRDEPDVTHAKGHHVVPSDGLCGVVDRLRVARARR